MKILSLMILATSLALSSGPLSAASTGTSLAKAASVSAVKQARAGSAMRRTNKLGGSVVFIALIAAALVVVGVATAAGSNSTPNSG